MNTKNYPFYLKAPLVLLGLMLLVYAMLVLRSVLMPLAFSLIIAILLNPVVNRFERIRFPRIAAIVAAMLVAVILLCGLLYFLSSQIARFSDMLPILSKKFSQILDQLQGFLNTQFGLTLEKQTQLFNDALKGSQSVVGTTLGSVLGALSLLFLIPVYVFMLLFYKPLMVNFLYEVFAEDNSNLVVAEVLAQTKGSIQSYMVGLMIEMCIIAVLNSTALMILGVDYAILLGVLGAILNLLPYIGGLIAIILPVLMATVTKDGYTTQISIIAAYAIIQFIDNNFIVPRIVSSKVQINALISILAVLLGGMAWGIPGMFLSIPFIAVLKIVFDRVEGLKPWGKLLGDEVPTQSITNKWKNRRKKALG